jgi:hypothetical protein
MKKYGGRVMGIKATTVVELTQCSGITGKNMWVW